MIHATPSTVLRLVASVCIVVISCIMWSGPQALASEATGPPEEPITESSCPPPPVAERVEFCGTLNPHSTARTSYRWDFNSGASCRGGTETLTWEEVEGERIRKYFEVPGLLPGTYTYCLVAWNHFGETVGQPVTLTTAGECSSLGVHTGEEPRAQPEAGVSSLGTADVSTKSHTLLGTIHLECGGTISYHFEYGTLTASGSDTPTVEVTIAGHEEPQELAHLTGLTPSTTYHYRLVATYGADTIFGEEVQFTTPPEGENPEAPVTEECGGPIRAGGPQQFCGTLNPGTNAKSGYYFAYNKGSTCIGGGRTPQMPEIEGERIRVEDEVDGLEPAAQYTYCLVATNSHGETIGQGLTFQTESGPPAKAEPGEVQTGPAEATPTGYELKGKLNPNGLPTTYYFHYWPTKECSEDPPDCGPSTAGGGPLAGDTQQEVPSIKVTALTPGETYGYELIASNADGTVRGQPLTFTTRIEAAPSEVETQPAETTPHGFVLKGKLNPEGLPTTYYFIYKDHGPECEDQLGCGPTTAQAGPLTGDTQREVPPIEVTGLDPGQTYTYWLIARNAKGDAAGRQLTFTVQTSGTQPTDDTVTPPSKTSGGVIGASTNTLGSSVFTRSIIPVRTTSKPKRLARIKKPNRACLKHDARRKAARVACQKQVHRKHRNARRALSSAS
jgi:hypothetical protein